MGDVITTNRFRRASVRERAAMRARLSRRRPWQLEHARAMRDFGRILADAPARRRGRRG